MTNMIIVGLAIFSIIMIFCAVFGFLCFRLSMFSALAIGERMKLSRCKPLFNFIRHLPGPVKTRLLSMYVDHKRRKMFARKYPNNVTFFVTDRCNMRCDHCFLKDKPRKEMTTEQIITLAESMEGIVDRVTITGGEPFIRKDLTVIADAFIHAGVKNIQVATNGSFPERVANFYKALKGRANISFQFSFDGPTELHDRIRGKGALLNVWRTIGGLKEIGFDSEIFLVSMVTPENISWLPYMIELSRRNGYMHEFNFDRCSPELPAHFDEGVEELRKYYYSKQTSLHRKLSTYKFDFQREYWKTGSHSLKCTAGVNDCIIWPNGTISICEIKEPIIFGELHRYEYNFKKMWQFLEISNDCHCNHDFHINNSIPYDLPSLERMFK